MIKFANDIMIEKRETKVSIVFVITRYSGRKENNLIFLMISVSMLHWLN